MRYAEADGQSSSMSPGYVSGPARGDHCRIVLDNVEIPASDRPYVADPLQLLPERESVLFAGLNIMKKR